MLSPSLPLHPQHFNWTIILPQSPAKNTAVRGLQVHGCLNKTQPNSRKSRVEGGESNRAGKAGWHWAPNICHLWSPLRLASYSLQSTTGISGISHWERRVGGGIQSVQWIISSERRLKGLKPTIIIYSARSSSWWQSARPAIVKLITENIRHFN